MIADQRVYRLKLRDEAMGAEVAATAFGRVKVHLACQSQGRPFS